MCLADYADPNGLINGWASQAQLAEEAEVSERSVREWMRRLEDLGLISRRRQSQQNGARSVDIIMLNLTATAAGSIGNRPKGEGDEAVSVSSLPAESAGRSYRQPDVSLPATRRNPTGTQFRAYKDNLPSPPSPPKKNLAPLGKKKTGCRLPEDFRPDLDWAVEAGLPPERAKLEAAKFHDYWIAAPGQKGTKLDWDATWRNWVRTAIDGLPRRANAPPQRNTFATFLNERTTAKTEADHERDQHCGPTIEASFERRD